MSTLRKYYRSTLLILWLITGVILTVLFLRNTREPRGFTTAVVSTWLGLLARAFGVKIKTCGTALKEKTLFVSNHISWLDILILGHLMPQARLMLRPLIGVLLALCVLVATLFTWTRVPTEVHASEVDSNVLPGERRVVCRWRGLYCDQRPLMRTQCSRSSAPTPS